MSEFTLLFLGDIIGKPGRRITRRLLPGLIERYSPDIVIANGENSAGGFGITPDVAEELLQLGIDVITTGNHVWDKKEIIDFLKDKDWLLRPANFPVGVPGTGDVVFKTRSGLKVGILNLQGRVFMNSLDCPFRVSERIVERMRGETPVIVVDMHGEATSEKQAMGWFLDGRVSCVIGTHTHVQTADERILPKGTAYITDVGMTGSRDSIIGIKIEQALHRFLTQMPQRFEVSGKNLQLDCVVLKIDKATGRAKDIDRLKIAL